MSYRYSILSEAADTTAVAAPLVRHSGISSICPGMCYLIGNDKETDSLSSLMNKNKVPANGPVCLGK